MLLRSAVLTVTCAAVLAACGGGGDSGQLTAAEYRDQGNAACQRYEQAVKKLAQPSSLKDVPTYADDARAQLTKLVDQLEALDPPADLQDRHDQLIALGRQSEDALGDLADAGESQSKTQITKALATAANLDQRSDALSRELGLNRCADQS